MKSYCIVNVEYTALCDLVRCQGVNAFCTFLKLLKNMNILTATVSFIKLSEHLLPDRKKKEKTHEVNKTRVLNSVLKIHVKTNLWSM